MSSDKPLPPIMPAPTTGAAGTNSLPPQVFDADLRRLRRARAARRTARITTEQNQAAFFIERCAQDASERLQDIARRFERALIIAPHDFWPRMQELLPKQKHPKSITTAYDIDEDIDGPLYSFDIISADDALPTDGEPYDLIISILSLHSVNDLPGALLNMRYILKADGLMMASVFGGDSLCELRAAFYATESAQFGGMSPRVFPMMDFSQAAHLLQRTGYALPVVDTDRFAVNYSSLSRLIADLRDAGQTNTVTARSPTPLSRSFYTTLEAEYAKASSTEYGKLKASFEILWMTGWAPHDSQQKPLKPGSAKMRLSEALGTKETKL